MTYLVRHILHLLLLPSPRSMKTLSSLLASAYLLSTVSPAFAAATVASDAYQVALAYVEDQGIVEPMSDGLMHGEMPISRREVLTSIVRDVYKQDIRHDCFDRIAPSVPARFTHLFTDISITNSSAQEICVGMFAGLVEGNKDGSLGAQGNANLVEAAKVITKAYGIAPLPSLRPQSGVAWHEPYWFALAKRNAIPETVKSRDAVLTRGEFAEILYRLRDERPTQGFHYQPTMVKSVAQNSAAEKVSDSVTYPSVVVSDSVVVSHDVQHLSDGLLLQMHAEQRRAVRLQGRDEAQATIALLGVEKPLLDSSKS